MCYHKMNTSACGTIFGLSANAVTRKLAAAHGFPPRVEAPTLCASATAEVIQVRCPDDTRNISGPNLGQPLTHGVLHLKEQCSIDDCVF